MMRQFELVERVCSYDPNADEDALNRAYVYAMKMHGSQLRASGDPYFSHPVEVAGILTEYKLDCASIITALLHDVVEDTPTTFDDIKEMFGLEIAQLVDGVTKLAKIQLSSEQAKQAENFRKLVLAMSEDIRVLLVKLADRLHNMRTLHFIQKPEKRKRIALETMEIYAPLAERIGMQEMKTELEGLAFSVLHPDAYESIIARLKFLRELGGDMVPNVIDKLNKDMEEGGLKTNIDGREKTPYSIWRKMQRQNTNFEQIFDIMAFRIIVDNIGECYQALGIIHSKYPMIPNRFTDYISTPKPNGYQSLHTGVIGPEKQRIEVQIRTKNMHEIAEFGVAAHWKYKQGSNIEGKQFRWLRELLEILDQTANPEEFLENTKLEMFQDQVFCFSPKGDLITLPADATPVDFAYAVHSAVGNKCVGCKINGRMRPLRTILTNGDQVEILTSKAQTPSPNWECFVVTGKARAAIRKFVRAQKRDQFTDVGKQILQKTFKAEGYDFSEKGIAEVLKNFKAEEIEDLYAMVGEGILNPKDVFVTVYPLHKTSTLNKVVETIRKVGQKKVVKKPKTETNMPIKGLIPGMAINFAKCCHPLPGDRIVGIVTTGKGVTIHSIDCPTLEKFSEEPERWLDVSWNSENVENQIHIGRLKILIVNEAGSLASLTNMIAKNMGNIANLKITNRTSNIYEMIVDIEVKDAKHLTSIIAALRALPVISSVKRASV
ncbi:MAG: bifunctional (p)ppGpp synthetase/guanosine-3',5'-bis(diphosphate) 3'-pyrophosphohydrolase [Alphaproteobacteria bacterium]